METSWAKYYFDSFVPLQCLRYLCRTSLAIQLVVGGEALSIPLMYVKKFRKLAMAQVPRAHRN